MAPPPQPFFLHGAAASLKNPAPSAAQVSPPALPPPSCSSATSVHHGHGMRQNNVGSEDDAAAPRTSYQRFHHKEFAAPCQKALDPRQDKDATLPYPSSDADVVSPNAAFASSSSSSSSSSCSNRNVVAEAPSAASSALQSNETAYPPGFEPRHDDSVARSESSMHLSQNNASAGMGIAGTLHHHAHPHDPRTRPHIAHSLDPHTTQPHLAHAFDRHAPPHLAHMHDLHTQAHIAHTFNPHSQPYVAQQQHDPSAKPHPAHTQDAHTQPHSAHTPNAYSHISHAHDLRTPYVRDHRMSYVYDPHISQSRDLHSHKSLSQNSLTPHVSHPQHPHAAHTQVSHLHDQHPHQQLPECTSYAHQSTSHPHQNTLSTQQAPSQLRAYDHPHSYQQSHGHPHMHAYQRLHDLHPYQYPQCLNQQNPYLQSMSQTPYQGVSYPNHPHPQPFPETQCQDNSSTYASTKLPSAAGARETNFQTYDAGATVIGVPVMNMNAHSYMATPLVTQSNQTPQTPTPPAPQLQLQPLLQPQPQPHPQETQMATIPPSQRNYKSSEANSWGNATSRRGGISQYSRNAFKFTKYFQGNHSHQNRPDREIRSNKWYPPRNQQENFEPGSELSRYSSCRSSSTVDAYLSAPGIQEEKMLCMVEGKPSNSASTPLNKPIESDASYSCSSFGGKNETILENDSQNSESKTQGENLQILEDNNDLKQRHYSQFGDEFKSPINLDASLKRDESSAMQRFRSEASGKIEREQSIAGYEITETTWSNEQSVVYQNTKREKEEPQLHPKHPNNCSSTFLKTSHKAVIEQNAHRRSLENLQSMKKTVDRFQQSNKNNGHICERIPALKHNDGHDKSEGEIEENQACGIHDRDLATRATNVKCCGTLRKFRTIELNERDIAEMEIARSQPNGFNRKQKDFTRNDSEISCNSLNTRTPVISDATEYHEDKENRANKRIRSKASESKILSKTLSGVLSATHSEVVTDVSENERSSGVTPQAESSNYVNAEVIHNGVHGSHNSDEGSIELNANGIADEKVNRTTEGDDGSHITVDGSNELDNVTRNLKENAYNTLSQKNLDEASSGCGFKVKRLACDVSTFRQCYKNHAECRSNKEKKNPPLQHVSAALQESSYLLQCCRFIVNNSFLQQKPPAVLKHFPWLAAKEALSWGVLLGQTASVENFPVEEKILTASESTEICVAPSSKEPEDVDVEQRNWEAGNSSVDNNKESFDIDGLTEDASLASVLLLQDFTDHKDQDMILAQPSGKNDNQSNDVSRSGFSSENQSSISRLTEGSPSSGKQNQPFMDWLAGSGQLSTPFKSHSRHNELISLQNQSTVDKLSTLIHPYVLMDSSSTESEKEIQACSWRRYYNDMGDYYHSSHDAICKHQGLREAATLNELIADAKYASMMSNVCSREGQDAIPLLLDQQTGTHLSVNDIDNQDMTSLGDDEDDILQYINFDLHGTESGICYD